jgi:hypothetical protein
MRCVKKLTGPGAFYHDCHRLWLEAGALKQCSFDVVVAGGGPAGVCAAVSAARSGARVLLVEREAGLGGNVRAAHVHSICGLYRIAAGPFPEPLHGGLAMEFARRLLSSGGACGPKRFGRLDILLHEPEAFAALCDQWVAEEPFVEVMSGARVVGGEVDARRLQSLQVESAAGSLLVETGAVVEATGDGNLAASARLSCACTGAAELQRPAYIFGLSPVATEALDPSARLALSAQLVAAVRDGRLGREALGVVVRPTCRQDLVRVTLDLEAGGAGYDPLDDRQIGRLTLSALDFARILTGFLRGEAPGYERAELCSPPARIGVRESRRVTGRCLMTAEDVLGGAVPEDTVCFSSWPLEWHEVGAATRLVYPDNGAPCGVPLRALQARDVDNVFLAGRCLSATHEAQAALRVIATSMATGQAAGLAAASTATGVRIDTAAIREACVR